MRVAPEFLFMVLVSQCTGASESSTSTGFTCSDYQVMVDLEVDLADDCSTDSDCTQILSGTGCGCATDDIIANGSFDTSYLEEIWDEAEYEGCAVSFDTACDCDASAVPTCVAGSCAWQ